MYKSLVILMTFLTLFSCQQQEKKKNSSSSDSGSTPPPPEKILVESIKISSLAPDFGSKKLNVNLENTGDIEFKNIRFEMAMNDREFSFAEEVSISLKPKEKKTYSIDFSQIDMMKLYGENQFQLSLSKNNKKLFTDNFVLTIPYFDLEIEKLNLDKNFLTTSFKINGAYDLTLDDLSLIIKSRVVNSDTDYATIYNETLNQVAINQEESIQFDRLELNEKLDELYNGEKIEILAEVSFPEFIPEEDMNNNSFLASSTIQLEKRYPDLKINSLSVQNELIKVEIENIGDYIYDYSGVNVIVEAHQYSKTIPLHELINLQEKYVYQFNLDDFFLLLGETYTITAYLQGLPETIDPNPKNNSTFIDHKMPEPPRPDFTIGMDTLSQFTSNSSVLIQNLSFPCYLCSELDLTITAYKDKQLYRQVQRTVTAPTSLSPYTLNISDQSLDLQKYESYLISIQINPEQSVIETNYFNNQISFMRSPQYDKDLSLDQIQIVDLYTIQGTITNRGKSLIDNFDLILTYNNHDYLVDSFQNISSSAELNFNFNLADFNLSYSDNPLYSLRVELVGDENLENNSQNLAINSVPFDLDAKSLVFENGKIEFLINNTDQTFTSNHDLIVRLEMKSEDGAEVFSSLELTLDQKGLTFPYTYRLTQSQYEQLMSFSNQHFNLNAKLEMKLDPLNLLREDNEDNNYNSVTKLIPETSLELALLSLELTDNKLEIEVDEISRNPRYVNCGKACPLYEFQLKIHDSENNLVYEKRISSYTGIGKNEAEKITLYSESFNLTPGETYQFEVSLDPDHLLNELDRTNNSITKEILIPQTTDLEIVNVNMDPISKFLSIDYKITDYNGEELPTIAVWFEYGDGESSYRRYFDTDVTKQGEIKNLIISGNDYAWMISFSSLEGDTPATLRVVFDYNNEINEPNESNNNATADMIIPRRMPNLIVSNTEYDVENLLITVKNVGDARASLGNSRYYYIAMILPDGTYLEKRMPFGLSIGSEEEFVFRMSELEAEEDVPMEVQIVLDTSNVFEESNEMDNYINTTILFENLPRPDFQINSIVIDKMDVVVSFSQLGDISNRYFNNYAKLIVGTETNEGMNIIDQKSLFIERNQFEYQVRFPIRNFADFRGQEITLGAIIDADNEFKEINENNNNFEQLITIPAVGTADLIIEDIFLKYEGSSYDIWVVVKNIGNEPPYYYSSLLPPMSLSVPALNITDFTQSEKIVGVPNRTIIYSFSADDIGISDYVNNLDIEAELDISVKVNSNGRLTEFDYKNNDFTKTLSFHPTTTTVIPTFGCTRNLRALAPVKDENLGFVRISFVYEGNCPLDVPTSFNIGWWTHSEKSGVSSAFSTNGLRMYPGKTYEVFRSLYDFYRNQTAIDFSFKVDSGERVGESDEEDNFLRMPINNFEVIPFMTN